MSTLAKVIMQGDQAIEIYVEDAKLHTKNDGPLSPPLEPHDFEELWDDVRANAEIVQETPDESTQNQSNIESNLQGPRRRRVRTREQDPNFTATKLQDVYTVAREDSQLVEKQFETLDRYLPRKIVNETRDHTEDCVRQGDPEGATKVLETTLETLKEEFNKQGHHDPTPWRVSMAEILIEQGQRQEARNVLSKIPSDDQQPTGPDAEYKRTMDELVEMLETKLDLFRRAEYWDKARETGEKIHSIDPSYFDLDKPMDRFKQVRRILCAGVVKEVDAQKATECRARNNFLSEALEIYNHGCFLSEAYYKLFDANVTPLSVFDHPHCANIFISAARICYYFDSTGYATMPRSFVCKGPDLTCMDWKHQALYFLEKGKARALLDTMVAEDIPLPRMARVADAAHNMLVKRRSGTSSASSSRASTLSLPVSQLHTLRDSDFASRGHRHIRSDSMIQTEITSHLRFADQSLRVETSNLSASEASSLAPSPAGTRSPVLTREESIRVRARLTWRRYLEWAVAQANPSLDNIPPDTLLVEFALSSTAPCGIIVIVAATDAVNTVQWKEADTHEIRRCIAGLRKSMETLNSRTVPLCQTGSNDPEQISSTASQERLVTLLRDVVVAPVQPHLEGKKKLIIVPSGDLAHVPWRIFFDLPVTVVPSLGIWARLRNQKTAQSAKVPKVSVVSTAPEDKEKARNDEAGYVRNIPFSRIEALYIAKRHEQLPFLADGKDRSDLEAAAEDARILHICAHSNFDSKSPMSSSLELFNEPFTIRDWHRSSIKAELVVFSSCLSGVSRAYDSGSTIGFAHILLGTGTKAFIGSLWKVHDVATLLLMTMFYEELMKPLPAVDALFEAQNRMRNLTDDQLLEVIDDLKHYALGHRGIEEYVINAGYYIHLLKQTKAEEWRQEKYWAAFVLTGYGLNEIYPASNEQSS